MAIKNGIKMKKTFVLLLITIILLSCSTKYHGYVYDFDKKTPVSNVEVYTKDSLNITFSANDGYFKIKVKEKVKELIFKKKGFQPHVLKTISVQSGEFIRELPFGDTIYLISKNSKYSRPIITLPGNNDK